MGSTVRLIFAAAFALWLRPAIAEEPQDVDPVELAALMVSDGHWDRAERVLADVDEKDRHLDKARFYTLRGLVRAHANLYAQAIEDFRLALAQKGADPLVNLHLARALLETKDPQGAVDAIGAAGEPGKAMAASWLLLARAQVDLSHAREAWAALAEGETRFPAELEFGRQRVSLLVSLGLYQEAVSQGRAWLAKQPGDRSAWLGLAEAMRNAGEEQEAIGLLEEARMRFPDSVDVSKLLGRLYLQTGHPSIAADILGVAAELDPALFIAAAESARQAGQLDRALYFNGRVVDPAEKARQRLGLYVEQSDWSRALALEERLDRLALGKDDGVRYALAYSAFQLGDVDRAERHLQGIADPRVFRDATALREAMSACRGAAGGCP